MLLLEYENKAEGETTVFREALAENKTLIRKREIKTLRTKSIQYVNI